MRLHWAASYYVDAGVALGYATHQRMLKAGLERQGVEFDEKAQVAVHIVTPEVFEPIPGKYNILYTMYECNKLPPHWVPPLAGADLIVVPCTQNKLLFSGYTDKPIDVCWEGVEVDKFGYVERDPGQLVNKRITMYENGETPYEVEKEWRVFDDNHTFTFLWVGASNMRKGYQHVIEAWRIWNNKHPELANRTQLYMKTTQESDNEERIIGYKNGEPVRQAMPKERVFKAGNAVVDTRKLPFTREGDVPGLVDLYQKADAFMLPSMGEGFGLTLAEAMSTGLPSIFTPWGGPVDFADKTCAYPVKYKMKRVWIEAVDPETRARRPTGESNSAASANCRDIFRQMERIYFGYEKALEKGRRAAERIREGFTWDISARSFMKIVARRTDEQIAA